MGLIELCLLSVLSPQEPAPAPGRPTAEPAVTAQPAPKDPGGAPQTAAPAPRGGSPEDQDPGTQNPGTQGPGTQQSQNQQPATGQPVESAPAEPTQVGDALPQLGDPGEALRQAESAREAGEKPDRDTLLALTACDDAAIAARAAWLLADTDGERYAGALPLVAQRSPHADARVQALAGFKPHFSVDDLQLAIDALEDDDIRVRTIAAQLLSKHRRPIAVEPLMQLVHERRNAPENERDAATDVEAALLTLTDLEATDCLLRVATELEDGNVTSVGHALEFMFQKLSQKLPQQKEKTTLVAVLDHREMSLRRYAVVRLAEIGDPTTIAALEGRLAHESNEVRPLVEIAVAQLRSENSRPPENELDRVSSNARMMWRQSKDWWAGLDIVGKSAVAGAPVLLLVLIVVVRRARRRRARAAEALAAADLVRPSDDFEQGAYEDDGYEEEYEDEYEGEYDDEYTDEEGEAYEDEAYEDEEWEEAEPAGDGRYR